MCYGLTPDNIERIQGVLARFPAIKKAILYGSRARCDHRPGSDLDLTLCGEGLTQEQLAAIAIELDDLLLPYTLDLSIFEQLHHADLRQRITQEGAVFYERQ